MSGAMTRPESGRPEDRARRKDKEQKEQNEQKNDDASMRGFVDYMGHACSRKEQEFCARWVRHGGILYGTMA